MIKGKVQKDKNGFHYVGHTVGAAAELSEEAPALEGGHGPLANAANLGVGGVVASLPPLETASLERDSNRVARALVCLDAPIEVKSSKYYCWRECG